MKFLKNVQQMNIYHQQGIFSPELYLDAIFSKKLPFLAKKSASNFFGPQLGKTKLIFLFYTFFRTSVQKIGDGFFFFFQTLKIELLV